MSKSIDNRIVKMQFDNAQFESGAKTTLGTLGRIKQALDFSGVGKSLQDALSGSEGANLSELENSVEKVQNKFSMLSEVAAVALGNIAAQAISSGAQLVHSFAVEPITEGFSEYELKMGAIQTLMNSTGEDLSRVNQKLNELNTYSDRTIYSFSDMTENIGKFTNAGVNLDDSVYALMGIANEAALAGANAGEAAHAMYNFGQALSSGSVRLEDWKSIELANMATVEFKNELISTALQMGTLVQEGDKFVSTTTDLTGHVSDAFDANQNFNGSLSACWMTSEVLIETLKRYADENTEIGKRAFAAAQEVKTFSQMMDTAKESVVSGWTTTWEILIGDFEEAKTLWTSVSQEIDKLVGAQANARNELLQTWKEMGGRADIIQGLTNIFQSLFSIMEAIGRAWSKAFPAMTAEKLKELSSGFVNFTEKLKLSEKSLNTIQKMFEAFFGVISIGVKIIGALTKPVLFLAGAFAKMLGVVLNLLTPLYTAISYVTNSVFSFENLSKALDLASKAFEMLLIPIKKLEEIFQPIFESAKEKANEFVDSVSKGFKKVYDEVAGFDLGSLSLGNFSFGDIQEVFEKAAESVKSGFFKIKNDFDSFRVWVSGYSFPGFSESLKSLEEPFNDLYDFLKGKTQAIKDTIQNFFNSIGLTEPLDWRSIFGSFSIHDVFEDISKRIQNGARLVSENATIALKSMGEIIKVAILAVAGVIVTTGRAIDQAFEEMDFYLGDTIRSIGNNMKKVFDFISEKASAFMSGVKYIFDEIISLLKDKNFSADVEAGAFGVIAFGIKHVLDSLSDIGENASSILEGITNVLDGVQDTLKSYQNNLRADTLLKIASAIAVMAVSLVVLAAIPADKLEDAASAIAVLTVALSAATAILSKISGTASGFKLAGLGIELVGLATSVLIISAALKKLSSLNIEELGQGILGVTAMVGELVALTLIMSSVDTKNVTKGVFSLLIFAQAIKTMATATSVLGSIEVEQIILGLGAIAALELGLASFAKVIDKVELKAGTGVAVIGIATGLLIMSGAVAIFGHMDIGTLVKGLAATAVLLSAVIVFAEDVTKTKGVVGAAIAIGILGVALLELSGVIAILGNLNFSTVAQGLIAMGLALAEVVIALNLMKGTVGSSAAILLLATALGILTPVLLTLGATWQVAVTGILVMAGALGTLALLATLISPLTPVLLALTAAMLGLSGSVVIAGVGVSAIAIGLGLLAAAIVSLSTVAGPAVDTLILVFQRMSSGILETVTTLAPLIKDAFVAIFKALLQALAETASAVLEALVSIGNSLIDAFVALAPSLAEAIVYLIMTGLQIIAEYIEPITMAAIDLVLGFISGLTSKLDDIVQAAVDLMVAFMNAAANAIRENTDVIIQAVLNVLSAVIEALLIALEKFVSLIPGIGDGIAEKVGDLRLKVRETLAPQSMYDIGNEAGTGLKKGIASTLDSVKEEAAKVGLGSKEGLEKSSEGTYDLGNLRGMQWVQGLGDTVNAASISGKNVTDSALEGLLYNQKEYGNTGNTYGSDFATLFGSQAGNAEIAGENVTNSALNGLSSATYLYGQEGTEGGIEFWQDLNAQQDNARISGENIAISASNGADSQRENFGIAADNAGSTFSSRLGSWARSAGEAAASIANTAKEWVMSALDEHSPSRVFMWLAEMAGSGFVLGFRNKEDEVGRTAGSMANSSVQSVMEAVAEAMKDIDKLDYEPTITPVLDLTGIEDNASMIQDLLGQSDIGVNANLRASELNVQNGSNFAELAGILSSDNAEMVDELKAVRTDIANLATAVTNMQIILDSGTLVGQIAGSMDYALATRKVYSGRGM